LWNRRGDNDDQTFSMKLLQNVLVLAADMNDGALDAKAIPASVVTLALTPTDAERVSLASESGTLRLILRRPDDETYDKSKPMRLSDIPKDLHNQEEMPKLVEDTLPPADQGDNPLVAEEKWEPIPAPLVRRHVVWIREGDRVRREYFELPDENDGEEATAEETQRPVAAQAPPRLESLPEP